MATEHNKDWPLHLKTAFIGLGTGLGTAELVNVVIENWGAGKVSESTFAHRKQWAAAFGIGAGLLLWNRKGADSGSVAVVSAALYGIKPLLESWLQPRLESIFEQQPQIAATVETPALPESTANVEAPAGEVVELEGFRRR